MNHPGRQTGRPFWAGHWPWREQRAAFQSSETAINVVYSKCCRINATLTVDDLAEMPDFKAACSFAVSQGWQVVEDDVLTLTRAGLAAA
jgi:hypothetical protein